MLMVKFYEKVMNMLASVAVRCKEMQEITAARAIIRNTKAITVMQHSIQRLEKQNKELEGYII